jgi:O-antigen/teichoic acid export membrane protein
MSAAPTLQAKPSTGGREAQRRRQAVLLHGVAFNWGSLAVAALVSLLLTPVMIRGLGAYYYGMWVLIMSLVDQYGLLDMGMGSALSRFAGYFQGAEQRNALDEVLSTSLAFTVLISIGVCLATLLVAALLPPFFGFTGSNQPTFRWLVILLGLTTAIAFPERMMAAYLRGIQRFDLVNIAGTSTVVIRSVLVVAALRLGYKVLEVAAITSAMGAASLVFHYAALRWADPASSLRWTNVRRARFRELFSFSAYAFIASLGTRLISRVDSIVIARVLSVALVTPFSIGSRLMDYYAALFSGVHGPLLSAMSELDGSSRHQELQTLFLRSSRGTLLLSFLVGSLLIFDGQALLRVWLGNTGLDSRLTYQILVILTVCYVTAYAQLPAWTVIYARARHQLLAWLVLGEGLANLALSIYWARRYGLVGVALGTAVPAIVHYLLIVPWYALYVVDLTAGSYFKQSVMRPLAGSLLFSGYCWLTSGRSQSLAEVSLVILSQLLVFCLFAYFIGLSADDRRLVQARMTGCLPRLHRSEN